MVKTTILNEELTLKNKDIRASTSPTYCESREFLSNAYYGVSWS